MEIKEIRRANLMLLKARYGSIAGLASAVAMPESHLGNLMRRVKTPGGKRERSLGDGAARKIEEALELSRGWMDQYHPIASDESAEQELLEAYRNSIPKMRDLILDTARKVTGQGENPRPQPPHFSAGEPIQEAGSAKTHKLKQKVKRAG